jgi:hypothetical protein
MEGSDNSGHFSLERRIEQCASSKSVAERVSTRVLFSVCSAGAGAAQSVTPIGSSSCFGRHLYLHFDAE